MLYGNMEHIQIEYRIITKWNNDERTNGKRMHSEVSGGSTRWPDEFRHEKARAGRGASSESRESDLGVVNSHGYIVKNTTLGTL